MNDKNCRGVKLPVFFQKPINLTFRQFNSQARVLGFEPRSKVLETRMLPLHHTRLLKSH